MVLIVLFLKDVELLYYEVGVVFLYERKGYFYGPVLLTDSEQVISERKIVSSSELLCQEMEVGVGRGRDRRGRPVANAELREEIRTLRARLEALETNIHHEHTGDTSDEEIPEEEEETTVETLEVRMLRSIFGAGSSSRADVPFYGGSLDPEELID